MLRFVGRQATLSINFWRSSKCCKQLSACSSRDSGKTHALSQGRINERKHVSGTSGFEHDVSVGVGCGLCQAAPGCGVQGGPAPAGPMAGLLGDVAEQQPPAPDPPLTTPDLP